MEQDVAAYYNQTQNHYRRWWQLENGMALHYGIWHPDTKNFLEALSNTNKHLAELAVINESDHILDAGCGVGGSAIYLGKRYRASVIGVSLSELQVQTAIDNAKKHQVNKIVDFKVRDYSETGFNDDKFDLIWACESSSSASDKVKMVEEWYRLLKPGGRLVLSDFFKSDEVRDDPAGLLKSWSELWAMGPLVAVAQLSKLLTGAGFEIKKTNDLTPLIEKTVKRMHLSYILGIIPAKAYNLLFGARAYARNHYKSGYYQSEALKKALWTYNSLLAIKPH